MPPQKTTGTRTAKQSHTNASVAPAASEQRRARNRLAQKAIRERKTAHIQRLERQLEFAQRDDGDSRVQALMEENANLRKAFLTVRKKFLSLSTTASLLADSLLPFVNAEQASTYEPRDELSPLCQNEGSSPAEVTAEEDQFLPSYASNSQCEPILDSDGAYPFLHQEYAPVTLGESGMPLTSDITSAEPIEGGKATGPLEARTGSKSFAESLDNPGNFFFQLGSPWNTLSSSSISFRKISRLSEHIDFIRHIMKSNGLANSSCGTPPRVVDLMLHEYLKQCWPPVMVPWFHVTNTCELIRAVLWWQVTNTVEAASQLLNVYAPTAIQLSIPHPSILDWVPHGTLRDLLILNQESFDIDDVIYDLAASYVVEVEAHDYLSTPRKTWNLMDAVEGSLRLGIPLLGSAGCQESEHVYSAGRTPCTNPKRTTSAEVHRYKIDSSFFAKYPALYDSTAVANGTANPPITMGNVPAALQFTNGAAQAYIRTAMRFIAS